MFALTVTSPRGRCRWCRCTHDRPCANGCGWADRAQTLCTACVPLERSLTSMAGRQELAEFLQARGFLAAAPARRQAARRG